MGLRSLATVSVVWRIGAGELGAFGGREQERANGRFVADEQEAGAGMALGGDVEAGHDGGRSPVATHAVDREGVGLDHGVVHPCRLHGARSRR